MPSFYADENFPEPVCEALRKLGHDVLTACDDGRGGKKIPDAAVLMRAIELNRIILTHDRTDYIRLHKELPLHPGIVICKVDPDFSALSVRIHSYFAQSIEVDGQLIRINRPHPSEQNQG